MVFKTLNHEDLWHDLLEWTDHRLTSWYPNSSFAEGYQQALKDILRQMSESEKLQLDD